MNDFLNEEKTISKKFTITDKNIRVHYCIYVEKRVQTASEKRNTI